MFPEMRGQMGGVSIHVLLKSCKRHAELKYPLYLCFHLPEAKLSPEVPWPVSPAPENHNEWFGVPCRFWRGFAATHVTR